MVDAVTCSRQCVCLWDWNVVLCGDENLGLVLLTPAGGDVTEGAFEFPTGVDVTGGSLALVAFSLSLLSPFLPV